MGLLLLVLGGVGLALAALDSEHLRASGELVLLYAAGIAVLALALGAFLLAWWRPVLLRVGPEGIHVTPGFRRPFPWQDVQQLSYRSWRSGFFHSTSVLKIELVSDAKLPYRAPKLRIASLDAWYRRNFGILVPLRYLDANEEAVIASVERFRPIQRVSK
jgi:hypothetical protein